MNASCQFRLAEAGDGDAIAALHADSWQRTYRGMMPDEFLDRRALDDRRRVWRDRLAAPDSYPFVLVATDGARIVGFICVLAHGDGSRGACIDNLHVAHDWRGRGVGRDLLRRGAEWLCRTQPGAGVYLWVMEQNTHARAFYDRLGARHVETVELSDPGGGCAPNCRYVWADPRSLL